MQKLKLKDARTGKLQRGKAIELLEFSDGTLHDLYYPDDMKVSMIKD